MKLIHFCLCSSSRCINRLKMKLGYISCIIVVPCFPLVKHNARNLLTVFFNVKSKVNFQLLPFCDFASSWHFILLNLVVAISNDSRSKLILEGAYYVRNKKSDPLHRYQSIDTEAPNIPGAYLTISHLFLDRCFIK